MCIITVHNNMKTQETVRKKSGTILFRFLTFFKNIYYGVLFFDFYIKKLEIIFR